MKKVQQGFTLIELMIVVAIIGILAAIAIPAYSDYISRTRAAGAMSELSSIKTAVSLCVQDNGGIFTSCDVGLAAGIPAQVATRNITVIGTVVDGLITATSGATLTDGTALTISNQPALVANTSVMTWTNGGSICNAIRGLGAGKGDCP